MTAKQVMRFLENDDSTAIHFRRFNLSPKDKYPTFTICLTGSELYWHKEEPLFKNTGLSPYMFEAMLRGGQDAFSYQYDYQLMLYDKISVDMTNYPNIDIGSFSLEASDILTELEYGAEHEEATIHHVSGKTGKTSDKIPLKVGYNTTNTVCYTRSSDNPSEALRTYDWLAFNKSIFDNEKYKDIDLRIFVHYPHQLMRSFHRPVFRPNLGVGKTSDDTTDFWRKLLRITITKIRVLRKRSGSNVRCDDQLIDDDGKFQEQLIKHINCTPGYWTRPNLPQKVCQSKSDLQNAHFFIENYKDILASYTMPCVQMEVFSTYDREKINEWDNPRVMFMYEDREYEEIQNDEDFGLESFVSGVGGFIGIFLGYSILQLPELLGSLKSLMSKLGQNNDTGKVYKTCLG